MQNKNYTNKIFGKSVWILTILNLLFIAYYIMLAFYSRFHFDDLHFLWRVREMDLVEFVSYFYCSWSGRFVSYFKVGLYSKLILLFNEYRYLPMFCWMLGVSMCWYVAKQIFKKISSFLLLNVVLLFYNVYVLTNIDFAVFNWLCAMDYYLLAPMLVFIIYLANKPYLSVFEWLLLLVTGFIFGGGQEAFTPIVLAALFINILFYFIRNKVSLKQFLQNKIVQRIMGVGILIFICFIIVLIAPGNYKRLVNPEFVMPTSIMGYLQAYKQALGMFYYQLSFNLHYYALLALLFVCFGNVISKTELKISLSYRQMAISSVLIYVFYVLLSVFPSVYLWNGFGIQRNYTPVVFFTILFIVYNAFLIGYFTSISSVIKKSKIFLEVGLVSFCIIMIFNICSDRISAKLFADSVDNRLSYLQSLKIKDVNGVVSVDSISVPYTTDTKFLFYKLINRKPNPQPVLYYVSDTECVPNEYSMHYCKCYDFKFDIKLK